MIKLDKLLPLTQNGRTGKEHTSSKVYENWGYQFVLPNKTHKFCITGKSKFLKSKILIIFKLKNQKRIYFKVHVATQN